MSEPKTTAFTIFINAQGSPLDQELVPLELPGDTTIAKVKEAVSESTGIPAQNQQIYFNGTTLTNGAQTLDQAGVKDTGAGPPMLALLVREHAPAAQAQAQRGQRAGATSGRRDVGGSALPDTETVRLRLLGDPATLANLRDQSPALVNAINDPDRFRQVYMEMQREVDERERERQNQIALLNQDPFNVDAQRRIEEMIRQDRVMENLQHAYENNPEVFGRVTMLYVNAEVNGHPIKAFVDSGAQVTIMSPSCAEQCGIMRLIDTRFSGMARGVGTAKILGRVHHAEIKIGGAVMPCAFTVMEGKDVDLLFGLDMLKRYRASIDLEKNALCFSGIEVPFLGESDIPKQFEEAARDEPTLPGPNGTEIGGRSGAVQPAGTAAGTAPPQAAQRTAQGNFQGAGQTVGSSSQPRQAQPSAGEEFPQESIDQLVSLGFPREEALQALSATNGNVEYAAGLLFSK